MKAPCINKLTSGVLLPALVALIVGCATSGYRAGETAGSALQASAARIESQNAWLDLTVVTLNDLVTNAQPDLRPQFQKFSSALAKSGSLADSIREVELKMQARSAAYFTNWDKQLATIQNEAIRSAGQARKLEVIGHYDTVRKSCVQVQNEARPLESDLRDVHKFLNADLTRDGLTAIKNATARINQRASPVNESVENLVADMRALGAAMSPTNSPPK